MDIVNENTVLRVDEYTKARVWWPIVVIQNIGKKHIQIKPN